MSFTFYEKPILNSPYAQPQKHWELDASGLPTNRILETRRRSDRLTPIPKPRKQRRGRGQGEIVFGDYSTAEQEYNPSPIINEIRQHVDDWRRLKTPEQWQITPETARLLQHWRNHNFMGAKPFFCQIEAVETAIWLAEVAPKLGNRVAKFGEHLKAANAQANPDLFRIALKLATGTGKTTVMAMLIAWQVVNAVRHPTAKNFSKGVLIVTPGLTIRDRLRVLLPNDPDGYYRNREIAPPDMLADIDRAKIVITNYHAFKRREKTDLSRVGRSLLQGRSGAELDTLETEGQMLQRALPGLMGFKNILVLNDEAHHCYREKPRTDQEDEKDELSGEDKEQAAQNNETARLWISGLETVKRKLGIQTVYDLSATPFFLGGSGHPEGALFPWTVSDFSLMDAIECGIVKLPRIPVSDNIAGSDAPKFRHLWENIGKSMPKKGRSRGTAYDPLNLPSLLVTALEALYGHYEKTFALWKKARTGVPPVFIIVCNNTATSKLVYDYISGYLRESETGEKVLEQGRLKLFRNYDDTGHPLARPNTLLIDSEQLESGEALEPGFRQIAGDEIQKFRDEIVQRTGDPRSAADITDQELLREVMNTVGKKDRLGEGIRCVVSVSMLTEGWDANTVTHILGIRAFGTQLLCEQVVGRALRRQSYDLNAEGLFDVEYADVLGVPFDFAADPVAAPPKPPRETVRVQAVRPDRDALEIRFPRIDGYRVDLPAHGITAKFGPDSTLELTPDLTGPSITKNQGIIGEGADLTIAQPENTRKATLAYKIAQHLLEKKFRDPGSAKQHHLFPQLQAIARQWLDGGYLQCRGGTVPAQVLYPDILDRAAERIKTAITETLAGSNRVRVVLDAYNPVGTTNHVNFVTSKETRWQTDPRKCPINWVICDSDWEAEFCRVAEAHPKVLSYVKNQNLGFEIPYLVGAVPHRYYPDFIVVIDDGRVKNGAPDPLNLIVEIKGYRGEDAKDKANTLRSLWVPGVNALGEFGRWDFAEFRGVFEIDKEFGELIATYTASAAA